MDTAIDPEVLNEKNQRRKIALLNDLLRTTGIGGKIMMTRGVASLEEGAIAKILEELRSFNFFSQDNDPYGEHDFGIIKLTESTKIYFKIDYYDRKMEFGSEDPSDSEKTTRVLTVMLAEEY